MTRNCQVNELLWIPRTWILTTEQGFWPRIHAISQCYWTPIKEQSHHLWNLLFAITLNQHITLQPNLIYRQTAVVRELVGNTDVTSDLRVAIGQLSSGNPSWLMPKTNQPTKPNCATRSYINMSWVARRGFETKKRKHWRNISGL